MKQLQVAFAAIGLGCVVTPAVAQSLENTGQAGRGDVRIQAGIVIPLGAGGTAAERAPRLEAWNDRSVQRTLPQVKLRPDFDLPHRKPLRVGVNFNGEPRLMLNGREAPGQDSRKGISGLGIAGIAVGAVVLAIAVFVIEYKTSGLGD